MTRRDSGKPLRGKGAQSKSSQKAPARRAEQPEPEEMPTTGPQDQDDQATEPRTSEEQDVEGRMTEDSRMQEWYVEGELLEYDPLDDIEYEDEALQVVSLEEIEDARQRWRNALDADGLVDTAHTDGSTTNPQEAWEQGLVYDPPDDPPVVPSDDLQGAEIGAGFAPSMEESNPDVLDLPDNVDNQDLDLEDDIQTALRYNSETSHLDNIRLSVRDGIVFLTGTVESDDDIAIVDYLIRDIEGVRDVRNNLEVEGL